MGGYETTAEVVEALRSGSADERERLLDALESEEIAEGVTALDALRYDWRAWGRPEQQAPEQGTLWRFLFLRAGRGGGKTRAGAELTIEAARDPEGCGGKIALIAPTHGDIRITMVEGESGILACSAPWDRPAWQPGFGHGGRLVWPNGVEGLCFSAEKPDRVRGPQFGFAWGDEIAAWGNNGQILHDLLNPALRLGRMPRAVYTSTPKPTPFVEWLDQRVRAELDEIEAGERRPHDRSYLQRVWSTFANRANLPDHTIRELQERYGGTTQGRQELMAELLLDDPDAAWSQALIDRYKVTRDELPEIVKIAVAVDNATTTSAPGVIDSSSVQGRNRDVGSNDTGICVAMLGANGHIYVARDATLNAGPAAWGERALLTFFDAWEGRRANVIAVERNGGAELIERNLDVCMRDNDIPRELVPIRWVTARDGKHLRADPVVTMYERGKVHHIHQPSKAPGAIGELVDLEYQMTRFKPGRTGYKDDRVDALVYAITALIDGPRPEERQRKAAARSRVYVQ